MTIIIMNKAS